ncbi:hypothetical protein BJY01DRAFT_212555 [Aspergillus pseudoustus]|uniref:Uncharacterized protein n=1 Tax=Aspergillus pseudoustus TaxID=1810923 RepID=A0ABR4K6R5_9EURO
MNPDSFEHHRIIDFFEHFRFHFFFQSLKLVLFLLCIPPVLVLFFPERYELQLDAGAALFSTQTLAICTPKKIQHHSPGCAPVFSILQWK